VLPGATTAQLAFWFNVVFFGFFHCPLPPKSLQVMKDEFSAPTNLIALKKPTSQTTPTTPFSRPLPYDDEVTTSDRLPASNRFG
jgi:hypothetical protein